MEWRSRSLEEEESRANNDSKASNHALVVLTHGSASEWHNGLSGRGESWRRQSAVGSGCGAAAAMSGRADWADFSRGERGHHT